jgi:hypothetical protein
MQGTVLACEYDAGTVAEVDLTGQVVRRLPTGPKPIAIAVVPPGDLAVVVDYGLHEVSLMRLSDGLTINHFPVQRLPASVTISADGRWAAVGNLLPGGASILAETAAAVTLIDVTGRCVRSHVVLRPGTSHLRGLAFTPDGRHLLAVHNLGRTYLPASKLENGWTNTNALSVIDVAAARHQATVLLDLPENGAADPWGLSLDELGNEACVSLAGVDQVAMVDIKRLIALLGGTVEALAELNPVARSGGSAIRDRWAAIASDRGNLERLEYDTSLLADTGLLRRMDLPIRGPRGIAWLPDGRIAALGYWSADIALVDAHDGHATRISLGDPPPPTAQRRGEERFHDARYTKGRWLSCATCHADARSDGLNWDLLNDGFGNPKNSKSMLYSMQTPPAMSRAVRGDGASAVAAGFRFLGIPHPPAGEPEDITAFLTSLEAERSPHLERNPQGEWALSAAAQRGERTFRDATVGCMHCHTGPYLTDGRLHDVGTRGDDSDPDGRYDTPTLRELWRSAPYLHNGSAATLRDVLTNHNPRDQHGHTQLLSATELSDLEAFLLSQ